MLDQDTIEQHKALLVQHRRRLAVLVQQHTRLGDYTPPHVLLEIEDAQAAIRNLKADLRTAKVAIEDEPNDDFQSVAITTPSRLSAHEQRNRSRMLDKVEAFWIKGVLEQSLYQIAHLELGFVQTSAQVRHPWESILHQVDQPNQSIPAGKSIIALFDELLGEMLILGAPGAGKTTMLLELTRDLIARARQNEQHHIPVVFNLSTWATKRQPLETWLADELNQRYDVPKKLAQAFVHKSIILPLLDGLDEVAAAHRDACVEAINTFRKTYGFALLAVCSRITDYEALTSKLRLQGAIVIQPLAKPQVDDYLKQVGRPLTAVRAALRDDPALWELMDNPLMLSIVALAYKNTSAAKLRASQTPAERRRQLFDDYIAAMFGRPGRSSKSSYTEHKTLRSLSWLARKMVEQQQTTLFLERIQPDWLLRWSRLWFAICVGLSSTLVFGLIFGLVLALVFGLETDAFAGLILGPIFGLGLGLLSGLIAGLSSYPAVIRPVETQRWSWTAVGGGWRSSLAGALIGGLGVGLLSGPGDDLFSVLVLGLPGALGGWVLGWLVGEFTGGHLTKQTTLDNPTFRRFVWHVLAGGLVFGLSFGLAVGRWFGITAGLRFGLLLGLLGGLPGGLIFGLTTTKLPTQTVDEKSIRRASLIALTSGLVFGAGGWLEGRELLGMLGGLSGTTFGWLGSWLGDRDATEHPTRRNTALRRFARNTLGVALGGGLIGALAGGLISALLSGLGLAILGGPLSGVIEGDITTRTVTNEGIRRSLRNAAVIGVVGGLLVALGGSLFFGLLPTLGGWLMFGLGGGLIFGLFYGGATVLQHYTLRWMLYRNGSLPLRLVPFLDYCAERIFLRKVGGGYVFVHRLLMEHFASLYADEKPAERVEGQQTTS
jgi:hypothetical protein